MYEAPANDSGYEYATTYVRRSRELPANTWATNESRKYEDGSNADTGRDGEFVAEQQGQSTEQVRPDAQKNADSRIIDRQRWISAIVFFINFSIASACLVLLIQMGTKFSQLESDVGEISSNPIVQEFRNFSGPSIFNHSACIWNGHKGEGGSAGVEGVKGDTGSTGISGPRGPQGRKGTSGTKGSRGSAGNGGLLGSKGEKGQKGATGPEGPEGRRGSGWLGR